MYLINLLTDIQSLTNPARAVILQRFFQTHPGGYGEGDRFLGLKVPEQRAIAKRYTKELSPTELDELIRSPLHECRCIALVILMTWFRAKRSFDSNIPDHKQWCVKFYLEHTAYINNRDLVDISAPNILGMRLYEEIGENRNKKEEMGKNRKKQPHVLAGGQSLLIHLARSPMLRERRIAMVSTLGLIRKKIFGPTLELARLLLQDKHHLMHKAVGWMLREVGNRSLQHLVDFLDQYGQDMPRTMLRYAVERLPERKRKKYLEKQ